MSWLGMAKFYLSADKGERWKMNVTARVNALLSPAREYPAPVRRLATHALQLENLHDPFTLSAMPEKKTSDVSRVQRENFDKGKVALQKLSFDYAISLFQKVLEAEPGFYECREALRAAQFKRAGGSTSFFKKVVTGASSQPIMAKLQLTLRRKPSTPSCRSNPSSAAIHTT